MTEKIKMAFQGEEGAYSHLAILEIFPKAEVKACSTFEEAFLLATQKPELSLVCPCENTVADLFFQSNEWIKLTMREKSIE